MKKKDWQGGNIEPYWNHNTMKRPTMASQNKPNCVCAPVYESPQDFHKALEKLEEWRLAESDPSNWPEADSGTEY